MQFQQSAKNAHVNFPEPNVMSSDNSLRHKDGSYIFMNDTEKQQILTFKRLNQQFFSLLYLKNDGINLLLIKIIGNYFSIYQLIDYSINSGSSTIFCISGFRKQVTAIII